MLFSTRVLRVFSIRAHQIQLHVYIVEILIVFTQCESNSLIEKMEQATNHAQAGKCETF